MLWNLLFTMFVLLPCTYCFLIKLLKINHLSGSWMSISITFIIIIINLAFPEHQNLYKFWDQYIKLYDWIINIFAFQQFCSFGAIDISMILCVKIWNCADFLGWPALLTFELYVMKAEPLQGLTSMSMSKDFNIDFSRDVPFIFVKERGLFQFFTSLPIVRQSSWSYDC